MSRETVAAAVIRALWAFPVFAVLEDSAEDDVPPAAAFCAGGGVWHAPSASCVDPALGLVSDDLIYAALRTDAWAGRYAAAMRRLRAMCETGTPRVLTAEGFIMRRTGDVGKELVRHEAALSLDPGYQLARACPGLWYLEQDDRAAAIRQLTEIDHRGGHGGDAWRLLSGTICSGVVSCQAARTAEGGSAPGCAPASSRNFYQIVIKSLQPEAIGWGAELTAAHFPAVQHDGATDARLRKRLS